MVLHIIIRTPGVFCPTVWRGRSLDRNERASVELNGGIWGYRPRCRLAGSLLADAIDAGPRPGDIIGSALRFWK
jgi:hypothetical protein